MKLFVGFAAFFLLACCVPTICMNKKDDKNLRPYHPFKGFDFNLKNLQSDENPLHGQEEIEKLKKTIKKEEKQN